MIPPAPQVTSGVRMNHASPAVQLVHAAPDERARLYRRWRIQIFFITWLAYAGLYLTRKSFSVAKIGMQRDPGLQMTNSEMGSIDGAYLIAYAIGQFVFGMAGDRLGPRLVVSCGMFCSVFAAVAMGASWITVMFGLLFSIQGLVQATGWGPLVKNMSAFFSRRERGTVMGLWSTNYPLGGLIASVIAGAAGDAFGWRYAFFVPAAGLVVVLVLFLLLQRNRPEDVGLPPIEEFHHEAPAIVAVPAETPTKTDAPVESDKKSSWQLILEVMTNPMVLLLSAVYFLLKPTRYAILFWGPKYVNARLGSGMMESGLVSALFELAGPVGALVAGLLSDRLFGTRRVPVIVISLVLLSAVLFSFDQLPPNRWAMGIGFFMIGLLLFGPDSLVAGTASVDFGTKRGASTASGLVNGWGSVGAVIGGTMFGWISSHIGFLILGGMTILAALIMLPRWNAVPKKA